ncbi:hypothetical protein CXF85_21200 [Colwellia sp. 75C3]|uniref:hypothetical protein n=1 Tax=Colwellia sp. 75C3 TaxID=888425 RepID=UPI000C31DEC4|nr:hypothetical protein [Colwellia sp. 75C3]PKG80642.1 hypothetical protein CXF85_21200 [Colwellia sp. 75C3]
MNDTIRGIILFFLISAAITCYVYSNSTGLWSFIIIGGVFEIAFWFGLFSGDDSNSNSNSNSST